MKNILAYHKFITEILKKEKKVVDKIYRYKYTFTYTIHTVYTFFFLKKILFLNFFFFVNFFYILIKKNIY
jgi:hypothetical protein